MEETFDFLYFFIMFKLSLKSIYHKKQIILFFTKLIFKDCETDAMFYWFMDIFPVYTSIK